MPMPFLALRASEKVRLVGIVTKQQNKRLQERSLNCKICGWRWAEER